MANPQKENGYTPVANEILERIAGIDLSGRDMRVVMVVLRKTFGFQKKYDALSHGQIAEATGFSRRTVIRAMQDLEAKHILEVRKQSRGSVKLPSLIGLNKNYDQWVVTNMAPQTKKNLLNTRKRVAKRRKKEGSDKQEVVTNNAEGSDKQRHLVVTNIVKKRGSLSHTKEKRNKEIQKKGSDGPQADPDIPIIIDLFKQVNPSYQRLFGMPPQRSATERLLKQYGVLKLSAMIMYLPKSNSSKFAPTITTPVQFEQKLGELIAWGQKEKNSAIKHNGRGVA